MEGCADGRLVGQTGILALDGVRVLVGVTAIVVAPSVPASEEQRPLRKENRGRWKCSQRGELHRYPCSSLCV